MVHINQPSPNLLSSFGAAERPRNIYFRVTKTVVQQLDKSHLYDIMFSTYRIP